MAFENVDPGSLKGAINSCLNSLNTGSINELQNSISNGNGWQTYASSHLINSFQSLIENKYRELKACLNSCNSVADQIQKYKDIEKENKQLEEQYFKLSEKLYYTYTYTANVPVTINGKNTFETKTLTATAKDYNVERQMNEIRKKINDNIDKMEKLEAEILGSC